MNDTAQRAGETSAITQVILLERQGRDRGWWTQMQDCFHPDSVVALSWIHDTGAAFVARSKTSFDSGTRPTHQLTPPVVHVAGDRAVAEVSVQIHVRVDFGNEADLISYTRLLYQLERREGTWRISVLRAIYDHDTVAPTVPGMRLELEPSVLARFRAPYRYLAYDLHLKGMSVRDDLYGDDQPERVEELYGEAFDWLRQE
jgi:hypothetical protein